MTQASQISVLGTPVSVTSYGDVCDRIQQWITRRQPQYIVAANVHVVMTAYFQSEYQNILRAAALVTPDGMPLVWGMRQLGVRQQQRVYGPDLMLAWCDRAAQIGSSIYLYGSTSDVLSKLSTNLKQRFPELKIVGQHAPPFRALSLAEMRADADRIQSSGADVVFVGLGCPKQEGWMAQQQANLDAVMIGVGAAFSFHSGTVSQSPRWMMRLGLEWVFRLGQEPQRLWSRYLVNNSAFVVLFGLQLMHHWRRVLLGQRAVPSSE